MMFKFWEVWEFMGMIPQISAWFSRFLEELIYLYNYVVLLKQHLLGLSPHVRVNLINSNIRNSTVFIYSYKINIVFIKFSISECRKLTQRNITLFHKLGFSQQSILCITFFEEIMIITIQGYSCYNIVILI